MYLVKNFLISLTYREDSFDTRKRAKPFSVKNLSRVPFSIRFKLFDTSVSSRTPPYLGISWKKRIVDDVSERYNTAVSELIETVQRTEEALKNRKARRALAGGMSDGEKVRLQLYLDQKAFVLAVEGVGLDPQTVEGVGKLIDLTKDSAHHHSSQAAASI